MPLGIIAWARVVWPKTLRQLRRQRQLGERNTACAVSEKGEAAVRLLWSFFCFVGAVAHALCKQPAVRAPYILELMGGENVWFTHPGTTRYGRSRERGTSPRVHLHLLSCRLHVFGDFLSNGQGRNLRLASNDISFVFSNSIAISHESSTKHRVSLETRRLAFGAVVPRRLVCDESSS